MEDILSESRIRSAQQQPDWQDLPQVRRVRQSLAAGPALVRQHELAVLRSHLAEVAAGRVLVLQCGDCAEDPGECTAAHIKRKVDLLDRLAGALRLGTRRPVLRVGRIAGQFAKPRSRPTEVVGGQELPAYQGHLVNGPQPTVESRSPDPLRLLTGYMAATDIMRQLGWPSAPGTSGPPPSVWTSHEALLLDYEVPLIRHDDSGLPYLGSTHWPWIGERTRQPDGAHVALLAQVSNPVACKIGPQIRTGELLTLCEKLDPDRRPGRLTLIARMGVRAIGDRLEPLVAAVRAAGHPVIWLTDPMHGNTVQAPSGAKTRVLTDMVYEVTCFQHAVAAGGGVAGGLHLETTPDDVLECVASTCDIARAGERSTSLCDPRLNLWQAMSVISAWNAEARQHRAPAVSTS